MAIEYEKPKPVWRVIVVPGHEDYVSVPGSIIMPRRKTYSHDWVTAELDKLTSERGIPAEHIKIVLETNSFATHIYYLSNE